MTAHDLPDTRTRHRLTVEEYLLLDREGAFGDRNTELFDGEVFYMSPKYRAHSRVLGEIYHALRQALSDSGSEFGTLIDISMRLSEHNVLEPDIVVTDAADAQDLLPLESAKLVIEVSDSTLATDLGRKADLYAEAGVPEYWVVDINDNRVLMHANSRKDGSGYDGQLDVPFGEPLHAATVEDLMVATAGLL